MVRPPLRQTQAAPTSGLTGQQNKPKASNANATGLGAWIRAARDSQGLSQRALAERAELSRSYLSDLERGRSAHPTVATLDKLATALATSRIEVFRAAGLLEPSGTSSVDPAEAHLIMLYRNLSPNGRATLERFARFIHDDEHRWVQTPLDGPDAPIQPTPPTQAGPTLFDVLAKNAMAES